VFEAGSRRNWTYRGAPAPAPGGGRPAFFLQLLRDVRGRDWLLAEVTPILQGCVYEPAVRSVSLRVDAEFGFAKMTVVSFAGLYAGKTVAALDRQRPRDLFEAWDLLANERIDDSLHKAFIVDLLLP